MAPEIYMLTTKREFECAQNIICHADVFVVVQMAIIHVIDSNTALQVHFSLKMNSLFSGVLSLKHVIMAKAISEAK